MNLKVSVYVAFIVTRYILEQQELEKKKNSKSRKKRKQNTDEEEGKFWFKTPIISVPACLFELATCAKVNEGNPKCVIPSFKSLTTSPAKCSPWGGDHTDLYGKPMCLWTPGTGFMEEWTGKKCRMRISEGVCCTAAATVNHTVVSSWLHVRQPFKGLQTHRHVFSLEQLTSLGAMESLERNPIRSL